MTSIYIYCLSRHSIYLLNICMQHDVCYFSNMMILQTEIGDKLGVTIQSISSFVFGIVIGFFYSWKLALALISLSPVMLFIGFINVKVSIYHSSREQTAYAAAAVIAEEVISSIKTVVAFGGEPYEINR